MAGTKAGGLKAAATNKARWGEGFYAEIGAKGGKNGTTGGFAAYHHCPIIVGEHRMSRCAGMKGGRMSKRGKSGLRREG